MFLFISIQRATAKQLESEERYRLLAENARDVIWTMELDGTITFISPSVEQMRGFTVEEAMHQSLDKILTPLACLCQPFGENLNIIVKMGQ